MDEPQFTSVRPQQSHEALVLRSRTADAFSHPPVQLTWLLVADVDVEGQDDDVGQEGRPPVDDEHDHTAQDGPSQRRPHVVVLEAGSPS